MRVRGFAAVVGTASVVLACGLDRGGLGDVASDSGASGGGSVDGGIGGADGFSAGEAGDSTAPPVDGTVEGGPPGDAAAETTSVVDAPGEGSTTDAPPPPKCPPGVMCNGACSASTDCHACPGATLLCPSTNTCGKDCAGCASSPIECFACDGSRANPIGTCAPGDQGMYCLSTNYAGAYDGQQGYHCACTTAADCPGDTQVCIGIGSPNAPTACFTCGETFTDMSICKTGNGKGKCNEMKAACN